MDGVRGPRERVKRAVTSARPDNDTGAQLCPEVERALEGAVDAAIEAMRPALAATVGRELAARLPHLRARPPARRWRVALPGDDAPPDDLTRALARGILRRRGLR